MDLKKLKKDLVNVFNEYCQDYQRTAKQDTQEYNDSLPVGSNKVGLGIYHQETKDDFARRTVQYRKRATDMLNRVEAEIVKAASVAPSSDAVNYVGLLAQRDHVTQRELADAMLTYGKNYAIAKSIREIAMSHEQMPPALPEGVTDLDAVRDGLDFVRTRIPSYFDIQRCDNIQSSIWAMTLDRNVPDD